MARNPRPCAVCGKPKNLCIIPDRYRPAKRTQPLRAKRLWSPSDGRIEIHVHIPGGTELTKDRLIEMLSEIRYEALR